MKKGRLTLAIAVVALFAFAAPCLTLFGLSDNAYADTAEITDSDIKKKALYRVLHECYVTDGTDSLRTSISYVGKTYYSVIHGDAAIFKGNKTHGVPSGFFSKNTVRCAHKDAGFVTSAQNGVMDELASVAKYKTRISTPVASNVRSRTAYYEGMGFTASASSQSNGGGVSDDKKCWQVNYTVDGYSGTSNKICFTLSGSKITNITNEGTHTSPTAGSGTNTEVYLQATWNNGTEVGERKINLCAAQNGYICVGVIVYVGSDFGTHAFVMQDNDSYDKAKEASDYVFDGWETGIRNSLLTLKDSFHMTLDTSASGSGGGAAVQQPYDTYTGAATLANFNKAMVYLEGTSAASTYTFDTSEMYYIYTKYLKSFGIQVSYSTCVDSDNGDEKYLPVIVENEDDGSRVMKWCLIDNYTSLSNSSTRKKLTTSTSMTEENITFIKVVEYIRGLNMNAVSINRIPAGMLSASTASPDPSDPSVNPSNPGGKVESGEQEATCYSNAGSLGWVVCPITETIAHVIEGIYQDAIEPALQLDTELFKTITSSGKESGTYVAWKTFRDMANIAFIVIFLFVLFSQLTGIGIDNYGVKKALPKLIIGAILINASYVICQLAVDLTDIVGAGIGAIFQNVTGNVSLTSLQVKGQTVNFINDAAMGAFQHGMIFVGVLLVIATAAFLAIGPTVLIPVFMAMISVLIAIAFLFIVLYVRQALAILLVAVSPLAFVTYILPNTKSIFDKWWKLFKGMLIAYPICSALIYGGGMASAILTTAANQSQSFSLALAAIVVGIIPIFLIPRAIQGSMGALGQIAGRLQGGLSRGARQRVSGSGLAQDMRYRSNLNRAGMRVDKDGNLTANWRGRAQDFRTKHGLRTTGSAQRLDARRAALSQETAKRGQAGRYSGPQGWQRINNQQSSARAAMAQQDVQDEISAMTPDYGGDFEKMVSGTDVFDQDGNVVRHAAGLNELLDKDTLTDEETLRLNALATYMANNAGSDGKKALGKAITGDHKQTAALAAYAAGKDSSVMGAIGDKNVYAQQYAKDLAAGRVKTKTVTDSQGNTRQVAHSFNEWLDDGKTGDNKGKNGAPRTNRQFITQEVLDDNDKLLSQSGDARSIAFQAKDDNGSYVISESRLQGALANEELMKLHPEALSDMQQNGRTLYGKADETFSQEYFAPNPNNGGRIEKRTRMVHRTADGTLIDSDGNVVQGTEKTLDQNGNIINGNKIDSRKDTIVESASYRRKGQTSGSQVLHRMADGTFRTDSGVTVPNIADFDRLGQ